MKLIRNKKGFTLAEIVITIGVIAIFSGFILQLFITAQNLNQKANDLDKSIMISTSIIEQFKSGGSPQDIKNNQLVKYTSSYETSEETKLYMNYDDTWNLLKSEDKNPHFILTAVITPSPFIKTNDNEIPKAYVIKVSVNKAKPYPLEKEAYKELYSIETTRYFSLHAQ